MGARELQALLREIKNVRSPVQRMKLMALAWRTVARLTPDERKELGSKLGVRGFERVLNRLGPGPKGIAPAEVLRALDGADELDPSKLRGLVRGIRDPDKRRELLRKGLDFLDRSLDEDEPVEIEVDDTGTEEEEETEAPEKATERIVTAEEIRPPEPVPVPVPEPVEAQSTGRIEAPRVEPAEPVVPPAMAVDEQEPEAAERVGPTEVSSPEPKPRPARRAAPVVAPLPFPIATIPTREALPDFGVQAEAAPSLIARFRALRRDLDDNGELETAEIRELLSEFPDGWARRRAVMALLRQGQPASLDDAIAVIEELERPIDRRWACATLIESRELSDDDARQIAERFPFPSLTRRLHRRFGRAE
jgi:hypothetical protein